MPSQVSQELIFLDYDLSRPRWAVEKEKLAAKFSGFSFYGTGSRISSVQGNLYTSYGNQYYVKITIPEQYPYEMPKVSLPNEAIDRDCPHMYTNGNICVMKSDQWSSSLSVAYIIAKAAVWLNKYDSWKRNGKAKWPGTEQQH